MNRKRALALAAVAVAAAAIGVVAYATNVFDRTELQTLDARYSIRGHHHPRADIAVVAISSATFGELELAGKPSRFPFPREYEAIVIDHLRAAGAKVIALDIEFASETDRVDDDALIEALARAHGKTALATVNVAPAGETPLLGGDPKLLASIGTRPGEARLSVDTDSGVRRYAYEYHKLHSLPVVAAEIMTQHPIGRGSFTDGSAPIDYAGPAGSFPTLSFAQVYFGHFPAAAVRGKLVLIGATAPILQDVHDTPVDPVMPGVEILANSTATALAGNPLGDAPVPVDVLLIIVMGLAVPLSSMRLDRWRAFLDAVALAVVFPIAAQIAFNNGIIVTVIYPMLALAIGTVGTLGVLYVAEALERERVRYMFARFVPEGVVDEVLQQAGRTLRLGGVERDCTVLFSDLRGFTKFAESQPAPRVIEVVNFYLNEMTEAILARGGTLVSYMGDGIMAVFGAPLPQADHADRAVAAAREMITSRLASFNAWLSEQGFDHSFEMGVGINSGPVMAGNVGSNQRVEYAAIGDTTNTASRLETMTKEIDAMVLISDTTRQRMRGATDELESIGELSVRGRISDVRVWTLRMVDPNAEGAVVEREATS